MNKQFSNLKMKQKDKITEWVYEEYKKYVTEHDKVPDLLADEQIVEAVLDKINEAQIWIPDGEIYDYYRRKKPQLQKRLDNEKVIKFKSYVSFYKSIVDQDRASVVICNLKHEIIYMNPAAVTSYAKRGIRTLPAAWQISHASINVIAVFRISAQLSPVNRIICSSA